MSSFIVPLKSGGGLGTAQDDGEAAAWPKVAGERMPTSPNTNQMNVTFVFIFGFLSFVSPLTNVNYSFSGGKIVFQSSFMLMTIQPFSFASSMRASLNVPIFESVPYAYSRLASS